MPLRPGGVAELTPARGGADSPGREIGVGSVERMTTTLKAWSST
ncbi:MAG: hypothetical protein ABSA02_33670 [Trebonia sp.]|jgi:hypothetical protein